MRKRAALLALIFALPVIAAEAEMKPYAETIPGTEVSFEMLPIPGGVFLMGSPKNEAGRSADEGPQHRVELKPFWMGKYEVTWDEFALYALRHDELRKKRARIDLKSQSETETLADAITRPTPPYGDVGFGYGRERMAAIAMTHHTALEYCRWLSTKTGKHYRLPTEAEWEYACRAGSQTAYPFDGDASRLAEYAWFAENAEAKPHPVGTKRPNAWGLYDMLGNVAEWCVDRYDKDFYAQCGREKLARSPVLLPNEDEYAYVARGGSWKNAAFQLRSAARLPSNPAWNASDPSFPHSIWWHRDAPFVGFRLVRSQDDKDKLREFKSPIKPNNLSAGTDN
ncbi:MAG TPA: SUMF1/EgtB/PvdO family nonheme iron enzyme [Planctomycetota bacterium]|jgi:formylglycine-generating enzyme required for sulfatase activity